MKLVPWHFLKAGKSLQILEQLNINPFLPNIPTCPSTENSKKSKDFRWFQGVKKEQGKKN